MTVVIDGYIGNGTLTMVGQNGEGHDGLFKIEVHVSGATCDLRGVVNILLARDTAERRNLPHHFSLGVTGSGTESQFNLIGNGPRGIIVEVDAQWVGEVIDGNFFPWR